MSNTARTHTIPMDELSSVVHRIGDDLRRVVVMEDNEAAARLMVRILNARENCEVYLAENGASGLNLVRDIKPDLVVTDLMMPDVDGFQVIEILKADASLQHIPVVVVTAKELTVHEQQYLNENAEMVLQKG